MGGLRAPHAFRLVDLRGEDGVRIVLVFTLEPLGQRLIQAIHLVELSPQD